MTQTLALTLTGFASWATFCMSGLAVMAHRRDRAAAEAEGH